MADRFWPDAKASIILLPSGEQGAELLELAAEWTRTGLLGPALWVGPEQVSEGTSGPPHIEAVVLGIGADLEVARIRVDLFEALAREALGVVRLVKLRSATPSRESDSLQDAIAERVREYVRKSMPMPNPSASIVDQSTELRYATLICAPTEFQLRQRVDWVGPEYGVVVIASPEDRSSPWSGDAFVRDGTRFLGFTLMHLASVGGLWSGVTKGSFELVRREESGHRSVWISRVFVNAVLTEALGRRAGAQVLADIARPDSLLVDPSASAPPLGTTFIVDSHVGAYVDEMVRGATQLDGGALLYSESAMEADPDKRRVGFWRQCGRFLAFSADKLVKMPMWTWRWITSRTHRRMTRALHTDEGAEVVGGTEYDLFDVRERELIADAARIADDERRARAEADAPAGLSQVRTTPELWARLRQLVFGALDGSSDLSEYGFAKVDGNVPIFGRVSDVLALPDEPWIPSRDVVPEDFPAKVDWYVLALEDPRQRLEEAAREAAQHQSEAAAAVAACARKLEEVRAASKSSRRRTAASAESTGAQHPVEPIVSQDAAKVADASDLQDSPTPDDEREAAAAPPDDKPVAVDKPAAADKPAVVRARKRLELAEAELESRTAEADRLADGVRAFDAWAVTQDRSFVWRLLTRLSDERRAAQQNAARLAAEIEGASVPTAGELISLRRRFHRRMLVVWGIALPIIGITLDIFFRNAGVENEAGRDFGVLWVTGITAVIALGASLGALVSFHSGWSRFQRRIDVQRERLAHLGRASRQARQEAERLTSLHRQTVEWLILLSRAIHKPWQVPEQWLDHEQFTVTRGAMPFALQVATVQEDDRAAAARLRAGMAQHLMVKGWRNQAFEDLVRETSYERVSTSSSEFGLNALDEDLPHASNHTRRMLLPALDDETILTRVAGPRLDALAKEVQRDDTGASGPRVRPVLDNPLHAIARSRMPSSHDLPWDDFLLESLVGKGDPISPLSATSLTDIELGERHHERVESFLVVPQRLAKDLHYPAGGPIHVVPVPDMNDGSVDLAWRVDIAGPVPLRAIHLWDAVTGEAPVSPPTPPRPMGDDTGV